VPPKVRPSKTVQEAKQEFEDSLELAKEQGIDLVVNLDIFCSSKVQVECWMKGKSFEYGMELVNNNLGGIPKSGFYFDYVDVLLDGNVVSEGAPEISDIGVDKTTFERGDNGPFHVYDKHVKLHYHWIFSTTFKTKAKVDFVKGILGKESMTINTDLPVDLVFYYHGHRVYECKPILPNPGKCKVGLSCTIDGEIELPKEGKVLLKQLAKTYS